MKRLSMVLALMLVLSAGSLWAQDVPKVAGFAGGSILNIDDTGFKLTGYGWTGSVTGNLSKVVGIVGEVGGNYKHGNKIHSFLGGAQFNHRVEKVTAFAQTKAGLMHFSDRSGSDNNFQLGFAGGVDWNINDKVAFRVFQVDWLPTRVSKSTGTGHEWVTNITRLSVGVVFKGESK